MIPYRLDVSLPVYKALTARLEEGQTHDDVLRELLGLSAETDPAAGKFENWLGASPEALAHALSGRDGFFSRGLWLPNGTRLRARYKQQEYRAHIEDNAWLDEQGRRHSSPSAAARHITGNNVNGLRFWQAKRPSDKDWLSLDVLALIG